MGGEGPSRPTRSSLDTQVGQARAARSARAADRPEIARRRDTAGPATSGPSPIATSASVARRRTPAARSRPPPIDTRGAAPGARGRAPRRRAGSRARSPSGRRTSSPCTDLLDQPHDQRHERRGVGVVGDLAQPAQGVGRSVAELARRVGLVHPVEVEAGAGHRDDQPGDADRARVADEVGGDVVDGPAAQSEGVRHCSAVSPGRSAMQRVRARRGRGARRPVIRRAPPRPAATPTPSRVRRSDGRVDGRSEVGRSTRSCQNLPVGGAGSTAASQTLVSAPWASSRSTGRVIERKRGSDSCTPGVSAQPGCITATVMPSGAQRSPRSGAISTCQRFERA